jgi:hypothetical protein
VGAFFRTDVNATVAEILATFADRFSLEITFRDCKEIVGAGQGNSCDSTPRGHRGLATDQPWALLRAEIYRGARAVAAKR